MAFGLCLQQDAPITFTDFEEKVLPAVSDAFGPLYTPHLLDRFEGGIYFSVRAGNKHKADGFNVRFNFKNWAAHVHAREPQIVDDGPLAPDVARRDWTHTLEYQSDTTDWTRGEKNTLEATLVKVLQWRPLRSRGYKNALTFYRKPTNYDYEGQIPKARRNLWKNRRLRPMLREMHIKLPRLVQHPRNDDESHHCGVKRKR
jgi:hypothetical protein